MPRYRLSESVRVTLHGERDFADVIKDLEMGRLPCIIQVTQTNYTNLYYGALSPAVVSKREMCLREQRCDTAGFEDGGSAMKPGI